MKRRIGVEWLLITTLLPLLLLLFAERPSMQLLGHVVYDAVLAQRPTQPSGQLVLVTVDQSSLNELGPWPWANDIHAQLLSQLAPLGPRSVLLNLPLDSRESAAESAQQLAQAMAPVPVYLVQPAGGGASQEPPAVVAQAAMGVGHAHLAPDEDGVVRRIAPWVPAERGPLPYVGLLLASSASSPTAAPKHFGFALAGRDGSYPSLPYAQLLRGEVAPVQIRGRDVLIGLGGDADLGTHWPAAHVRHADQLSDLELHANAIDALRAGRTIRTVDGFWELIWIVAPVVLGMVLYLRRERYAALSALGLAALCCLVSGMLLSVYHWWLSPVAPAMGVLTGYLLWSWRRQALLFKQFQRRLRYLDRAAPGEDSPTQQAMRPLQRSEDYVHALDGAMERLSILQNVFRQSLRELPVAVVLCGRDGTIRHANPAARAMLNLRRSFDAEGRAQRRSLPDVLGPLRPAGAPALADTHWAIVHQGAVYKRGDYVFRVRCVPLRGNTRGWAVVLDDLSAEHRIQAERAQWLRFLSHDLRSPQANILSHISIDELQHPDAPGRAELADAVRREVYRTLSMAEGFMDLSQAESGDFTQEVLVLAALNEAVDQVWTYAHSRGVTVALQHAFEDELFVRGNATLLSRALVNLLNNAIRHSPEGAHVYVCVALEGTQLQIQIRDEGDGMTAAQVARLRGDAAPAQAEPSAGGRSAPALPKVDSPLRSRGIGLAVVWTVVQQHGGHIDLWSAPGAGTSFLLQLPLLRLEDPAADEDTLD